MIVVDVNVIAYLLIEGSHTAAAEAVLRADPEWAAPLLWRSEWRNVLAGYLRRGELDERCVRERIVEAEALVRGRELLPDSDRVMELVTRSDCSAYDCEYVAVANELAVPLVTTDQKVLASFEGTAVSPEAYLGSI